MSVRTDVINLNINVNGNQAQNNLNELRKKAASINYELKGMGKNTAEFAAKRAELDQINAEMDTLKKTIGMAALSLKELRKEEATLKALRSSAVPFSKEYKELDASLKQVQNRIYEVSNGVQGFAATWSKVKDEVKQFGLMAAGYLGFQFLSGQITNIISGAGKMSDELANIEAKTGMTADEVGRLNSELKETDTRTANSSLRSLAAIGGQLGVFKDDIEGFTVGMDKLNVVMGDEFNNSVEDLSNSVSKVRNTFGDLRSDNIQEDLMKIGNGLTVLAQNGVATAPITTDIASRVGAAGSIYGMAAHQTFGLAAAYQELNISTERGSTATVKLLQKISSAPELFYQVAASVDPSIKSLDDFTQIVNTDITKAFLLVAQGFAANKGNATQFADSLADAEIGSAAIAEVLAKVGQNSDLVKNKIALAGDAFQGTGAIMDQFNIKNNDFQAQLDKLSKEFNSLATSPAVTNFLESAVEGALEFIRILKNLPAWLNENRTSLIVTATVILAYAAAKARATQASILNKIAILLETAAQKLETAQIMAGNIVKQIAIGLQQSWIVVTSLLTGKITIATAAQRAWNIATSTFGGVLSTVILAVGAVAATVSALTSKTKELSAAQSVENQLLLKMQTYTENEVVMAKILFNTLQQKNLSRDTEKNLLGQLIKLNPQYLSGLNEQNIRTAEGAAILEKYTSSLKEMARTKAQADLIIEKEKRKNQLETENQVLSSTGGESMKFFKDIGAHIGIGDGSAGFKFQKNAAELKALNSELDVLYDNSTKSLVKKSETSGKIVSQSAKTTVADLKAQLQGLQQSYEQIDISDKKSLKANLDARKQLQTQIDALEGKKSPSAKAAEKQFNSFKKEAEDFKNEVAKIQREIAVEGKTYNDDEVAAIQKKYGELIIKAKKYSFDLLTIKGMEKQEMENLFKKRFEIESTKLFGAEYDQAIDQVKAFYDKRRGVVELDYANNLLSKQQYSQNIQELDTDEKAAMVRTASEYAAAVKKAAEDVTKFTNEQEEQQTKNAVENARAKAEQTSEERFAKLRLNASTSRPGSSAQLDAQKAILKAQFEEETKFMDKKSAMYLEKEQQLKLAIADLDKQANLQRIENIMQYVDIFSNAMNSLVQIINAREQRLLQKEQASNDKKRTAYKQQLDGKMLSQSQYDLKMQKLQEEQDSKEREIKRRQARREKAMNLFNAVINNAAAVVKTMASVPYPLNIPLAIAQGIAGALQIGAIVAAPLPELGKGYWLKDGPKHSDAEKGTPVLIERDEAVMAAAAMTDNTVYTVTGTPAQITSTLNSRNGGVKWAQDATLSPRWRSDPQAQLNPRIVTAMATGGYFGNSTHTASISYAETNDLLRGLIEEQRLSREELRNWKGRLKSNFSIKQFREMEKLYDNAAKSSGSNQ